MTNWAVLVVVLPFWLSKSSCLVTGGSDPGVYEPAAVIPLKARGFYQVIRLSAAAATTPYSLTLSLIISGVVAATKRG